MRWDTSNCPKGIRSDSLGPKNGVSVVVSTAIHDSSASDESMKEIFETPPSCMKKPSVRAMLGAVSPAMSSSRGLTRLGLSAFNGVWASKDDGEIQGQIVGMELMWEDGSRTPLQRHGEHGISMVVDNHAFTGFLSEGRIKWCDGDTWLRPECPSESMLQAEPIANPRNTGLFRNWEPQTSLGAPLIPIRQRRNVDDILNITFRRERKGQFCY
jgi:hypothetical protein